MTDAPETRFTTLGRDRIAYQVVGDGPFDLVYAPAMGDCIELRWDYPPYASFLHRLASFSRLIMFDRRGEGSSDPVSLEALPSWEEWADDARAVLDAVGSERAAILGNADAGPLAILFAATQPERTQALILATTTARYLADLDYPGGMAEADIEDAVAFLEDNWGTEAMAAFGAPDSVGDAAYIRFTAKSARLSCSRRAAGAYLRWDQRTDVRQVLASIRVPTLVLHRMNAPFITLDQGRYLADHIDGARFVTVAGSDIPMYTNPSAQILDHIEEFLTGVPSSVETDRVLAAVLFTDIVGSTERATELGDRRWRDLIESHDTIARTVIDQHRGRLVKTTGDGVLATFDGPGRAIRCAAALRDALASLRIEIRAGVHTGEIELLRDDIGGIGVHIADRVQAVARPGEVLVSETVPRLVTGSGIEFEDRGEHTLKGVPGTWRLYTVLG